MNPMVEMHVFINAPDLNRLANAILALAEAINNKKESQEKITITRKELQEAAEKIAQHTQQELSTTEDISKSELKQEPEPSQQITLEQIRIKLASLAQAGKQAQVKELIAKFGGKKLTDIPPEKYPELLAEAEAL